MGITQQSTQHPSYLTMLSTVGLGNNLTKWSCYFLTEPVTQISVNESIITSDKTPDYLPGRNRISTLTTLQK